MEITGRVRCRPDLQGCTGSKRGTARRHCPPFWSHFRPIGQERALFGRLRRGPGTAGPLARRFRGRLRIIVGTSDRGRQNRQIQTALAFFLCRRLAGAPATRAGCLCLGLRFRSGFSSAERFRRHFRLPLFHAFLERRFFYRWTLPAPFVAVVPVVAFIAIAATPVVPPLAIIALLVPTAIEILPEKLSMVA